ncbi:MAG: alpha/beta hydrolase [Myxococcales bacterium]|nr:alpha/beta hydrolase [Myxococcales bacterium]
MPRARVGELELCYESMGQGAPLLLVMGLGAQLVQWPDALCHQLVERGFRVIRFDNRDVGRSSRLDHLGTPRVRPLLVRWGLGRRVVAPYSLDDMADDAAGLLRALGVPRAHVLGVSMGGMIAQLLALRHPGRVASLTSVMSHPGDRRSSIPRPRALRALLQPPPRTRAAAEAMMVRFYQEVGGKGFPFDEAGIRERAGLHFDRGSSPRGVARQIAAILAAPDRRPALRSLQLPSLVIHGLDDPLVRPAGGVRTAKALPGSTLLRIPGMGHDLPRGAWPRIIEALCAVTGVRAGAG